MSNIRNNCYIIIIGNKIDLTNKKSELYCFYKNLIEDSNNHIFNSCTFIQG